MHFSSNGINPDTPFVDQGITAERIIVEDNVWPGAGEVIIDRMPIGKGAVVAAGAVVTRDVPPIQLSAECLLE